ncbi:MAG: hypothetical protein QNK83_00745 [Akkermansiaceae bacterium]
MTQKILLLASLLIASPAFSQETEKAVSPPKGTSSLTEPQQKILFIGNSYTAQVKAAVIKLFAVSPHQDIGFTFITPGGRSLTQHLENKATLKKIAEGGWDIVVLQDQSQTPAVFPKKFLAASLTLHRAINKAGAKTTYYETWGHRDGDKRNAQRFPTYEKMQKAVSQSYQKAAKRDDAILVRVGEAWRSVRAENPALGEQLYKKDGSHPSAKGAYLAACCFYSALTDDDPRKVDFHAGLDAGTVEFLREKATATQPRISPSPLKK